MSQRRHREHRRLVRLSSVLRQGSPLLAIIATLGLLGAACGSDEDEPTGTTFATTETSPSGTTAARPETVPPTDAFTGAEFTIAPAQGPPGTVFVASGSGCTGSESSAAELAVYITVRIEDVADVPTLGDSGSGFVVEQHLVSVADGSWTEDLDSGAWPHWAPGAEPPQYDGVGANPGVYRVSARCGPPDPTGITIEEPSFRYADGDLVVTGP